MCVNSRKAGAGTVLWKHQLHETCGEQLTTAIVVVGAPDMLSGGTGEWILACERRKNEKEGGKGKNKGELRRKQVFGGREVCLRKKELLIFPPIHLSHILSRPCSPHAPLMTFPCSSYHGIFHSHVHAILTAIFSLSTPCHAPICFPKKTTTPVLCSITAHACATT